MSMSFQLTSYDSMSLDFRSLQIKRIQPMTPLLPAPSNLQVR